MSQTEKDAQLGQAVAAYQAAKREVAHVENKIEEVFKAYLDAGRTMDRSAGSISEPKIVNGKLKLGWFRPGEASILSAESLATLVMERDELRVKRDEALRAMQSLGVSDLR